MGKRVTDSFKCFDSLSGSLYDHDDYKPRQKMAFIFLLGPDATLVYYNSFH